MKEIKPYKTLAGLMRAIDNGGRFYNLFSHAEDKLVTRAELAKAAGVFSSGDDAFLFLEMAQQELSSEDRASVEEMLETDLRRRYRRQRPRAMKPSTVDANGEAGTTVITTGYPRYMENKTEFNGYIMIPITTGTITTYTMVPIFDQFDVYELFDDARMKQPSSMIARSRAKRLDHDGPVRFGGVLRKLEVEKGKNPGHNYYLEAVYYTRLS